MEHEWILEVDPIVLILRSLGMVKLVHTAIWVVIATCIVAIPFLGWAQMYTYALVLTAVVLLEALVLVFNGWRCPLTEIAARCTDDRSDNFDIYLPLWIARNNKRIFGSLFLIGEVIVLLRWFGSVD